MSTSIVIKGKWQENEWIIFWSLFIRIKNFRSCSLCFLLNFFIYLVIWFSSLNNLLLPSLQHSRISSYLLSTANSDIYFPSQSLCLRNQFVQYSQKSICLTNLSDKVWNSLKSVVWYYRIVSFSFKSLPSIIKFYNLSPIKNALF